MHFMLNEPDIVKELKYEEKNRKFGLLQKEQTSSKTVYNNNLLNFFSPKEKTNLDQNNQLLEQYKTIIEKSSVGLIICDVEEKIIYYNNYVKKILNFNDNDLFNNHINFLYPKDEWKKIRSQNIMKKNIDIHIETKMLRKDNTVIDIDLSLSTLKDKDGNIIGSIGIINDISERKRFEYDLKIKDYAILSSSEAICFTDLSLNISYVNPSFLNLWEYGSEQKLIGNHLLKKCKFNVNFKDIINQVKKSDSWSGELIAKRFNGEIFAALCSINLVKDVFNEPICIMLSMIDVTENRRLQKRIEIKNEEIKKLLKQKDEFINQLGHDLKNPLNPLINLLPILYDEEKNIEHKKIINILIRNVRYMKELVMKMISLAKLSSPKTVFNMEDLDFSELINDAIESNELLFKQKNIEVKNYISDSIKVKADRVRVLELLNNILSNSIKYSKESGNININAQQKDEFFEFAISDNGIGMTKEQTKKIFDEFYKVDTSRHDFESCGLGMSICRRIIERHGGSIWVESPGIDRGTTIYFTLSQAFEK
jgi:PAS domain S-box-containing protein